ncbi:hypothetical protein [Streptosporangium carneum]|uniref:Uncharacterized protein n=1 Tax=Streptosporangium carneum TaxID=47481 RepID=A0A9W6I5B1_9ACTN|nr:hypothetical protein [Streptosporangium carneum]GLK11958.1 hypothetical protein GCM10017600_53660 [Streptosporangium carneum]
MRRWIALVTAALLAPALVTTAPSAAQAAPADPVKALKPHLRPGYGVQVAETQRFFLDKKTQVIGRLTGSLEFGVSRHGTEVVATDQTQNIRVQPPIKEVGTFSTREIVVGDKRYTSGDPYDDLPTGKTWVRSDSSLSLGNGSGQTFLNVFEPATLRFLTRGSGRRLPGGVQYRGENTRAELSRVSASFRRAFPTLLDDDSRARRKVRWRLWLDARGLPVRVVTEGLLNLGRKGGVKTLIDTRYTGWGSPSAVAPPPEDQVIDQEDYSGFDPEAPLDIVTKGWKER